MLMQALVGLGAMTRIAKSQRQNLKGSVCTEHLVVPTSQGLDHKLLTAHADGECQGKQVRFVGS